MFLANLALDEKKAFLSLANSLIAADGVLNADEVSMMEQYKQEMSLTVDMGEMSIPSDQAIKDLKAAIPIVQKQVVFELVALACADKEYADTEHDFIAEISSQLGIDKNFLQKSKSCIEELTDLYSQIGRLISE